MVLASHQFATSNEPFNPMFAAVFQQGRLGVCIFFVISGFIITLLLLQEHHRTGTVDLQAFYIRRALRILPVYFFYLAILALLQAADLYRDTLSSWLGAVTFTRNVAGNGRSATAHLWSLAVEEQFYLIWPIALTTLGLWRRWRLALAVLSLVAIVAFAARALPCDASGFFCQRVLGEKSIVKYADFLAMGCSAAILYRRNTMPISPRVLMHIGLLALAATLVPDWQAPTAMSAILSLQTVAIAVCVYGSIGAQGSLVFRVLNAKPIVWLGLLSYSLYVWHVLFLTHYVGDGLSGTMLHDYRLWWLAALLTAIASFYLYERPILQLGKGTGVSYPQRLLSPPEAGALNTALPSRPT